MSFPQSSPNLQCLYYYFSVLVQTVSTLSFRALFFSIFLHHQSLWFLPAVYLTFSAPTGFWINSFLIFRRAYSLFFKGLLCSFITMAVKKKRATSLQRTKIHPKASMYMTLPTLSYVPASHCPKDRPSCADTITLLISERGKKDSKVLASLSRLWGSGSLQQSNARTQQSSVISIQCKYAVHTLKILSMTL